MTSGVSFSTTWQRYYGSVMGELEDSVLGLLRSSEELRAVLEAHLAVAIDTRSAASRSENYNSEDIATTRILAVISHRDDWSVSEEGRCVPRCLLVNCVRILCRGNPNDCRVTLCFSALHRSSAWACYGSFFRVMVIDTSYSLQCLRLQVQTCRSWNAKGTRHTTRTRHRG